MAVYSPSPQRRPYQFGLRALLILVTLTALITAWVGHLHRRALVRTQTTLDLAANGILVDLEEPNWLGQLTKKFAPGRETWLRDRLGSGWLGYPTVFCCWELKEEQLPEVADRMRRLGTVREFHFRREPPKSVADSLRRELPDVDVLTTTSAIRTYYQRRFSQPVFAFEGAAILSLLALGLISAVVLLVRRVLRRRSPFKQG
jgi:hypothetical protein